MSKIEELLKNEKVEWKKLGDVCQISKGKQFNKRDMMVNILLLMEEFYLQVILIYLIEMKILLQFHRVELLLDMLTLLKKNFG